MKTKIFHIVTLFPDAIQPYLHASILGRAVKKKLVKFDLVDLRKFGEGKHKQVDDRPFGGGAGMVLKAEPILRAVDVIRRRNARRTKIIIFSAKGRVFNQKMAYDWSRRYDDSIIIAGRYEGIDERVKEILHADEISIGHYVLTDGDVAAMVVVSAVVRLLPGVIRLESLKEESHWNLLARKGTGTPAGGGLEYPHYTRPEVLVYKKKKYTVPDVLLSGNHEAIRKWRNERR